MAQTGASKRHAFGDKEYRWEDEQLQDEARPHAANHGHSQSAHCVGACAIASSDAVNAPVHPGERTRRHQRATIINWTGWSVAAIVAISWVFLGAFPLALSHQSQTPIVTQTADALFDQYRKVGAREGRILRELPKQMVSAKRQADGTIEVVYLRRLLEREIVGGMFTGAVDDQGKLQPVPLTNASLRSISGHM